MDKRIHIMHIQESLEVGGLENGVVNIANGLDPSQFQTTICCIKRLGTLTNRIINPAVNYFCLDEKDGKRPTLFFKFKRLFNDTNADIIHTHNFYSGFYGILGAKLAINQTIVHGEHGNQSFSGIMRKAVLKYIYPLADRILTVSDELGHFLIQSGIPDHKVKSIHNGVDIQRFSPRKMNICAKSPLNSKGNSIIIGYVGRISKEKGVDRLLKAFSVVQKRYQKTRLMVAGNGPMMGEMEKLCRTLGIQGAVNFCGERDDVHELYRNFDIFVLPSLVEGLSNVLLEAMASGVAIVATDVGGNKELIDDGENGLVVSPDSIEALCQAMERLISDQEYRERLGKNARAKAQSEFSIERMVKNYESFYMELVRNKKVC